VAFHGIQHFAVGVAAQIHVHLSPQGLSQNTRMGLPGAGALRRFCRVLAHGLEALGLHELQFEVRVADGQGLEEAVLQAQAPVTEAPRGADSVAQRAVSG
jgi:hypothetical protein